MTDTFAPASLVPELSCSNFAVSLDFYTRILGFRVLFERPENKFAYIALGEAQIMIEQTNEWWKTGELQHPYGRGINFQIRVDSAERLSDRIQEKGVTLFREIETSWYRKDDGEIGQMEFLVQDPDGYLLRFSEPLTRQTDRR